MRCITQPHAARSSWSVGLLVLGLGWVAPAHPASAAALEQWVADHRCAVVSRLPLAELPQEPAPAAAWEPSVTAAGPPLPATASAWLRRVLVIEPAPADGPFLERLFAGVPDEERGLLLGGWRGYSDDSPELCAMLADAVFIMIRRLDDEPSRRHLQRLCYWMAADLLDDVLRCDAGLRDGTGRLWIRDREPTEKDPSRQLLLIWFPVPGPDHGGRPLSFAFSEETHDPFAYALERERGLIGVEEFTRRLVAAALESEQPEGQRDDLLKPVSLDLRAARLDEVARQVTEASGVPIAVDEDLAAEPLTVVAAEQPARDLLPAIARAAGAALTVEGDGFRLSPPACVWERLDAQAPLGWWAASRQTKVERNWCRMVWSRALWATLDDAARQAARAGPPLTRSSEATRAAARRVGEVELGRLWRVVLDSLPDRAGVAPLWLYPQPEEHQYEISSPCGSEVLRGYEALRLELRLEPGRIFEFEEQR